MRVTVTQTGPSLADVTKATIRDLRAVNKTAGKALGKVGTDAINAGAPTMFGRKLRGQATVETWPDRLEIEYHAARGQAGAWQIQESGARPHDIYPKARRPRGTRGRPTALELAAGFYAANVWHPGWAGAGAWTRAADRLARAIGEAAERLYDNGIGAR